MRSHHLAEELQTEGSIARTESLQEGTARKRSDGLVTWSMTLIDNMEPPTTSIGMAEGQPTEPQRADTGVEHGRLGSSSSHLHRGADLVVQLHLTLQNPLGVGIIEEERNVTTIERDVTSTSTAEQCECAIQSSELYI
jgi:hypothetical protein